MKTIYMIKKWEAGRREKEKPKGHPGIWCVKGGGTGASGGGEERRTGEECRCEF